jgi:endonuclease/exonuclease/phosphatase (EEP) superfamily protein YafD
MIYPYTFLADPQVQQSKYSKEKCSFSAICTNVLMSNRRVSELKEIIRKADPDIILALETNQWWVKELAEFESKYSHVVKKTQDNLYGMVLYSKLELINSKIKFLVQDDIPSIHTRAILESGKEIRLHCLHPRPPFPTGSDKSTERDAELLIVGKEIKNIDSPTVVLGDLNDVAWSKTNYLFQDISGLLDPRVGRGFYNTFHAKYPFIRFPLDHFFHSNHFRLIDFKRLDYFGSDHFPVYIELSFEPEASTKQEELKADKTEEKEAEEKIQKET